MQNNPFACAVIIGETQIIPNKFGREYKSIIIEGAIELKDDPEIITEANPVSEIDV